jgi:hypothetical protein
LGVAEPLDSWRIQLALCAIVALVLRAPSFGDPNIHVDEAFYFFVGQQMHKGALLYADIWDHKPLGLFLIYYLIAGLSRSVFAYQLVAWLFAAATAFVIARIASLWTPRAVLAGLFYLALMLPLEGIGGQAPVFYNLPMVLAAWAIVTSLDDLHEGTIPRRVYGAMLLCGLAITIKQTTLFESAFFGAFVLTRLRGWRMARFAVVACALGAAPTLAIAAYYLAVGHWYEFWQAMVVSNLTKGHSDWVMIAFRVITLVMIMFMPIGAAFLGLALNKEVRPFRPFLVGWIVAALIGFFVIPNAYRHYALPLAVPLCVAGAAFLHRRIVGPAVFAIFLLFFVVESREWSWQTHADSAWRMRHLAETIRQHNRGGLLVFDGPPALYSLSGAPFMTPLVFPHHLNHLIERNVSQFDTAHEIRRIIANKPSVVVVQARRRNKPPNLDSRLVVFSYIADHCKMLDGQFVPEFRRIDLVLVYGDCV